MCADVLCCECLARGKPVIFVGEGKGGRTGSTTLWTSGLPIQPLREVAVQQHGLTFVDVSNWQGFADSTWFIMAPRAHALAERDGSHCRSKQESSTEPPG